MLWSAWGVAALLMPLAAQTAPEIPEKNPFDSAADAASGAKYFLGHCAFCHGPNGEGGRGVNLTTGRYRHGGGDRELFRTISKGVPGTEMPGSPLSPNEVWRLVAFVRRLGAAGAEEKAPGDARAGQAIYEGKGACAQCHFLGGRGGGLGPELDGIGQRRSLQFLRESLLEPDRHISDEYQTAAVVTASGESISGILLNEDDYSVQVRDLRGGLRSFRKLGLKEVRREKRSLMPAYGGALSPEEIENLVAYLSSLRGKSE